jgi:hypothetical protein
MSATFGNVQMNIMEPPPVSGLPSVVTNTLAKFVDMDNIFSTNNIILFVSLLVTLLIVGLKMKLIPCPSDGILCRILEKIPFLKSFVPAKKQVEFAPAQEEDDDDDSDDDDAEESEEPVE